MIDERVIRIIALVVLVMSAAACADGGSAGTSLTLTSSSTDTVESLQDTTDSISERRLRQWIADCNQDAACESKGVIDFLVECYAESGFLAVVDDEGVIITDDGGRPEEFIDVRSDCLTRLVEAMPPPPVADEAFFSAYYDFLLELKECVEGRGYVVEDPPSRDAFTESDAAIWHPYQDLDYLTQEEMTVLQEACPQEFRG